MHGKGKIAVNLMLLATSLMYGTSYAYRKTALTHIGPFLFNACRFFLGFLGLFVFYLISERIKKNEGKADVGYKPVKWQVQRASLLGLIFSVGVTIQQLGLITSSAGKCGFITTLYIFFTPIISWLILKKHISAKTWVGATIAVTGLFFISAGNNFGIVAGDVLFLLTAILFAIHIILIGRYVNNSNPILLVMVQMLICAVFSAILFLLFEGGNILAGFVVALWPILYTGLFSVAVGNVLQFTAQKRASPSITAIILSFESVFAAVFAAIIISERMNLLQITGCALIFSAIIISQVEYKSKS